MSKSAHTEPKFSADAYELETARGNTKNTELFGAFGEVVLAGPATNQMVWPGPTARQPYSSIGVAVTIQSDSANDTLAGTGIQRVQCHYIDVDGYEQNTTLDMNGVTPVAFPENIKFIQCVHADLIGTGLVAAGNITVTSGATVYSYVKAGDTRCTSASRYVPTSKRLIIREMVGGAISGTSAAQVKLALVATQIATHIYTDNTNIIYIRHNQVAMQDTSESLSNLYLPFDQGVIVSMMCSSDKAATVTASWGGWIEDA